MADGWQKFEGQPKFSHEEESDEKGNLNGF